MNNEELKKLMLRSLTDDLSEKERAIIEKDVVPELQFSNGFRGLLMDKITSGSVVLLNGMDFLRTFDLLFRRIAITGVAAIILLALTVFISEGSFSYDTILGLDSTVDEGLISLLVE